MNWPKHCILFQLSHLTRNAGKVVTMSGGLDVLQMKEEDVLKFLAAGTHLGGTNLDFQMDQYVYKRKSDGEWWNGSEEIRYRALWHEILKCLGTCFDSIKKKAILFSLNH